MHEALLIFTIIGCFFSYIEGECNNGMVRLVNGGNKTEGRLEVCYSGQWGTVCDDKFSSVEARVVCRQLGYEGLGVALSANENFGVGDGDIWLDDVSCVGNEDSIFECQSLVDDHNCQHSEDVGLKCSNDTLLVDCDDGMIQLNGENETEGLLEVCLNGQWGTVCEEGFGNVEGTVACRQLGFGGLVKVVSASEFGVGNDNIWLANGFCTGHESSIFHCYYYAGNAYNCNHEQDVGVECFTKADSKCEDFSVRLVNGTNSLEGRLEMCFNGEWGTVCDFGFGITDGAVFCRQLGFEDATVTLVSSEEHFGTTTGNVLVDNVNCKGTEDSLTECTGYSLRPSIYCSHIHDVGLRCNGTMECEVGAVRLANGIDESEGRVEVCYNNQWGTVCDYRFELADGRVVCRQLGFEGALEVSYFGPGSGHIWLDDVLCNGDEENIVFDCEHIVDTTFCSHFNDVGVRCYGIKAVCDDHDVRLVNGEDHTEGRLEVCYNGQWGTVCSDEFGYTDAEVICRQLGFKDALFVYPEAYFGAGEGDIWLDDVECSGTENNIFECKILLDNHDCLHTQDVGLKCTNETRIEECDEGLVHLENGQNENEGILRVCYRRQWNTVCADEFDLVDGSVTCRQLGFEDASVKILPEGYFDSVNDSNILMHNITCEGHEDSLFECISSFDSTTCISGEVGLQCYIISIPKTSSTASTTFSLPIITTTTETVAMETSIDDNSAAMTTAIIWSLSSIVAVLIFLTIFASTTGFVICILKARKRKKHSLITRRPSQFELMSHANDYAFNGLIFKGMTEEKKEFSEIEIDAVNNPHLANCLITASNLDLKEKIGQGEFGIVYRGILAVREKQETNLVPVAVKTLKSQSEMEKFMEEAYIMQSFDHMNVLALTGVCVGLFQTPCIVMPFMSHGSLLSYLRKESADLTVSEMAEEDLIFDTTKQLLSMCMQVAKGMAYLSTRKFVHRDLAARNCMMSMEGVIKVADFGLAEDIYTADYFKQSRDSDEPIKLPIKWMALESVHFGRFNEMTDVWSYGVLCWEVFTTGRAPYPGLDPRSVIRMLDSGERLDKPSNLACTQEIYNFMMSCWDESPKNRPHFADIVNTFEKMMVPLANYMEFSFAP